MLKPRRARTRCNRPAGMKQVIEREKPRRVFRRRRRRRAGSTPGCARWVFARSCAREFRPPRRWSRRRSTRTATFGGTGQPACRRCGFKSKEWLEDPAGAQIPDRDALRRRLRAVLQLHSHSGSSWKARTRCATSACRASDEWDARAHLWAESCARRCGIWRKLAVSGGGGSVT